MGIRVHKTLGYGLTDVAKDDSRVNWDSALLSHDKLSGEDYLRWLYGRFQQERKEDGWNPHSLDFVSLREDVKLRQASMHDCLEHGSGDGGLPNVLLLRPLCKKAGWARYDDDIDYMTETYLAPTDCAQDDHVETFQHGIFPFNGIYMDSRTGQRLKEQVMMWIRIRSSLDPDEFPLTEEKVGALDEVTGELTPFASFAEADQYIAPMPPREVTDIADYGSLFTGPLVWTQLRPLLYTYWA